MGLRDVAFIREASGVRAEPIRVDRRAKQRALAWDRGAIHECQVLADPARSMAEVFAADNTNFDRMRFMEAAGFPDYTRKGE